MRYRARTLPAGSIDEILAALIALAREPNSFPVRGALRDESRKGALVKRRHKPAPDCDAPDFISDNPYDVGYEARPRSWLALDIDGVSTPEGIDPDADPDAALAWLRDE